MSDTDAAYRFVSWLHSGAAAQISIADGDAGPPHVSLPVSIEFNEGARVATTTLDLLGPGDITALDPTAIQRVWPPAGSPDAEANLFPLVEFAQPDLPWRYTPRTGDIAGRLRPWCALIVLTETEIAVYEKPRPDRAASAITIAAGTPMPPIAQAWAWAHVHISGDDNAPLADTIATAPERCLARLLCPRRLRVNTSYWACIVPTFEIGRLAGLRLPVAPASGELAPAWTTTDGVLTDGLTLPVYHRWRFDTGPDGDFESLVRKVSPGVLPPTAGLRSLDVRAPGGQLPSATLSRDPLLLGGALISPSANLGPDPSDSYADAFADLVAIAPDAIDHGGRSVIVPPLYGTWHAGAVRLVNGAEPRWFNELNLDPRLRVPAALGAAVVQTEQDALMASAWMQVDGIREANARLRSAQLAREISRRFHTRFVQSGTADRLLQLAAPLHARVLGGSATFAKLVRGSPPRTALFSSPFRRLRRARGPLGRRQLRPDAVEGTVISNVNSGAYDLVLVPTPVTSRHLLTHEWVRTQQPAWHWPIKPDEIETAPRRPRDIAWDPAYGTAPRAPTGTSDDSPSMAAFREAAIAFAGRKHALDPAATYRRLALPTLRSTMITATDPATTIPAAFGQRLASMLTFAWNPPDPIEPVMAYPQFPQPMYAPLAALSQDWIMPGLSEVAANTATIGVTNDTFIEAYMVGLNHEMARELLWNDYPTDQRGSYFRQFWDPAGVAVRPTPETAKDITPLNTWTSASRLGEHSPRPVPPDPSGRHLVLVVRSEVLRRYPRTVVYAQRAVFASGSYTLGTEQRMPSFGGHLDPDLAFFGFELAKSDARGTGTAADPGWFVVFQEQPHAPRFGLDIGVPEQAGTAPGSWNDLAWPHLVAAGHLPDEISYIDLDAELPRTAALESVGGAAWHLTSASVGGPFARGSDHAAITLQRPVRVAMHASLMLLP
ncbi:MAG: hypothetical protein ACKV2T_17725 [Kofleriaceae bacterium]